MIELVIPVDNLTQQIWSFGLFDLTLYVNRFEIQTKITKRHKWITAKYYSRLENRYSTIKDKDVPLTEEIKNMAIQVAISRLSVENVKSYR